MKNSGAWYAIIAALFTYMLFKPTKAVEVSKDAQSESPQVNLGYSSNRNENLTNQNISKPTEANLSEPSENVKIASSTANALPKKNSQTQSQPDTKPISLGVTTKNIDIAYPNHVGMIFLNGERVRVDKDDEQTFLVSAKKALSDKNKILEQAEKALTLMPASANFKSMEQKRSSINNTLATSGAMQTCSKAISNVISNYGDKKELNLNSCQAIDADFNLQFTDTSIATACKEKMFLDLKFEAQDRAACVASHYNNCVKGSDCHANVTKLDYNCKLYDRVAHRLKNSDSFFEKNKNSNKAVCTALAINITDKPEVDAEKLLADAETQEIDTKSKAKELRQKEWEREVANQDKNKAKELLADNSPTSESLQDFLKASGLRASH